MTPGTDVVEASTTDVVVADEALLALQAQQEAEIDEVGLFQTPILKIGQSLTREVKAGDADEGEFINTLTGESIGTKVPFVVAYYQRGRFAADRDTGRAYVAFSDTIPQAWADLVGEEFVGTPFTEYPDAEEKYKQRVNLKEIEWGKGPLVSTTHNFTGLALVENDAGETEQQPVRLSLQRTNMPAVRKILTLKKASPNFKAFWDKVLDLTSEEKPFPRGAAYLLSVKLGRDTTAEEKQQAVALAQAVAAGRVTDNQEQAERDSAPVEPEATGGLAV